MNIFTASEFFNDREVNTMFFTERAFCEFCQGLNNTKFLPESKEEPCKDVFQYVVDNLRDNTRSVVGFIASETSPFQYQQWYIIGSVKVEE